MNDSETWFCHGELVEQRMKVTVTKTTPSTAEMMMIFLSMLSVD